MVDPQTIGFNLSLPQCYGCYDLIWDDLGYPKFRNPPDGTYCGSAGEINGTIRFHNWYTNTRSRELPKLTQMGTQPTSLFQPFVGHPNSHTQTHPWSIPFILRKNKENMGMTWIWRLWTWSFTIPSWGAAQASSALATASFTSSITSLRQ